VEKNNVFIMSKKKSDFYRLDGLGIGIAVFGIRKRIWVLRKKKNREGMEYETSGLQSRDVVSIMSSMEKRKPVLFGIYGKNLLILKSIFSYINLCKFMFISVGEVKMMSIHLL